jgi:CheY-like chemotaxis protein
MSNLILVVEDDPTLQMVARRVLGVLGFQCVTVGTGEEAVQRDNSDIELIFMDIGLPGIDGGHATLLIRENELRARKKRVPIIALTGHADAEQCLKAGMDDFLQKPALMADFDRVIKKWCPHLFT